MGEVVDGESQKYTVESGALHPRAQFFGKYPELLKLVESISADDQIRPKLKRGGHDPDKVYAAFNWPRRSKPQGFAER